MPAKKLRTVNRVLDSNIVVNFWKQTQNQDKYIRFMTYLNLDSGECIRDICKSSYVIYTSVFNKWYLTTYCQVPENRIIALRENESTEIYDTYQKTKFKVTPFDANYYAGSLMFLFQGSFGNVLYTGFFRLSSSSNVFDAPALKTLIDKKEVNTLYLDNTYAAEHCVFPPKAAVIDQIIDCLSDAKQSIYEYQKTTLFSAFAEIDNTEFKFQKEHSQHKVIISGRSFGKEEVLVEIAKALNEKIHINEKRLSLLSHLGCGNYFTTDKQKSRIFAYDYMITTKECLKWQTIDGPHVIILLTAYYECSQLQPYFKKINIPGLRVFPYSSHSSHSELMHFVSLIRPHKLVPIIEDSSLSNSVIPKCMYDLCRKTSDEDDVESLFFESCCDGTPFSEYFTAQVPVAMNGISEEILDQLNVCDMQPAKDQQQIFTTEDGGGGGDGGGGTVVNSMEEFLNSVSQGIEYQADIGALFNVNGTAIANETTNAENECVNRSLMECDPPLFSPPADAPLLESNKYKNNHLFDMLVVNSSSSNNSCSDNDAEDVRAPSKCPSPVLSTNSICGQLLHHGDATSSRQDEFIQQLQTTENVFINGNDLGRLNDLNLSLGADNRSFDNNVQERHVNGTEYSKRLSSVLQMCSLRRNESVRSVNSMCNIICNNKVTNIENIQIPSFPNERSIEEDEQVLDNIILSTYSRYLHNKYKVSKQEIVQKAIFAISNKNKETHNPVTNLVRANSNYDFSSICETDCEPQTASLVPYSRNGPLRAQSRNCSKCNSKQQKILSYIATNPAAIFDTEKYYKKLARITSTHNESPTSEDEISLAEAHGNSKCNGVDCVVCTSQKQLDINVKRNQNVNTILHQYSSLAKTHQIDSNDVNRWKDLNGCDLFSHPMYKDMRNNL